MSDFFKDAVKMGMGAVWLSRENLKKITDDLVEIGKVSKDEGDKLFREFEKSKDEYSQKINANVEKAVQKAMDSSGLAKKSDVDALRKRVAELENKLAAAKAKKKAKKPAARKKAKAKK